MLQNISKYIRNEVNELLEIFKPERPITEEHAQNESEQLHTIPESRQLLTTSELTRIHEYVDLRGYEEDFIDLFQPPFKIKIRAGSCLDYISSTILISIPHENKDVHLCSIGYITTRRDGVTIKWSDTAPQNIIDHINALLLKFYKQCEEKTELRWREIEKHIDEERKLKERMKQELSEEFSAIMSNMK